MYNAERKQHSGGTKEKFVGGGVYNIKALTSRAGALSQCGNHDNERNKKEWSSLARGMQRERLVTFLDVETSSARYLNGPREFSCGAARRNYIYNENCARYQRFGLAARISGGLDAAVGMIERV